ncbi:hypothetical protein FRC11_008394 [Ceratobasidium sp. 423]|nr:hypothetical protein FRC11_008394 [Ceratobasidium sp. 423]
MLVNSMTDIDLGCVLPGMGKEGDGDIGGDQASLLDEDNKDTGVSLSSDLGDDHDSIYTCWSDSDDPKDQDIKPPITPAKFPGSKRNSSPSKPANSRTPASHSTAATPSTQQGIQAVVKQGIKSDQALHECIAHKESAAKTERKKNKDKTAIELEKIKQEAELGREKERQTGESQWEKDRLEVEKMRFKHSLKEKEMAHHHTMELVALAMGRGGVPGGLFGGHQGVGGGKAEFGGLQGNQANGVGDFGFDDPQPFEQGFGGPGPFS